MKIPPSGPNTVYTLTATAVGADGVAINQVSSFSTLTPSNQTKVSLTTTAGAPLQTGSTYGVGTVVVAHFDEPIADRAAAERRLVVSTTPQVAGSWYWLDDQNAAVLSEAPAWMPGPLSAEGETAWRASLAAGDAGRALFYAYLAFHQARTGEGMEGGVDPAETAIDLLDHIVSHIGRDPLVELGGVGDVVASHDAGADRDG